MKKRFALSLWTCLALISVVVTVTLFLFIGVTDLVGLITDVNARPGLVSLDWADLLKPLTFGFDRVINFENCWVTILSISIVGLWLIATIAVFVLMGVKKKWKYLCQFFVATLIAFVGLYIVNFVLYVDGGPSIARQLVTKDSFYFSLITFGASNTYLSLIFWGFLVFCLVTFVTVIGMMIQTTINLSKVKVEKKAKVEKEVSNVDTVAPLYEETKKEEKPVQKKKVVLVVKRYDAFKNSTGIEKDTEYPREKIDVQPLTKEDIRRAISEELDARNRNINSTIPNIVINNNSSKDFSEEDKKITVSEADAGNKKEDKAEIPTPVIVAIPTPVKERVVKEKKEAAVKEPSLTKDQIREIIKDELAKAISEIKLPEPQVIEEVVEEVHEVKVPVKTVVIKEEVKAPVQETRVETKEEITEEPVPTPVQVEEVVPEVTPTPVVEETKDDVEETGESQKIERIPFATRIREADAELKDNYNQIKSLLLSYGLKNRTSNGGDAFRLHKVTYCKITVAGKSLKLYLALDPADYKNTTLPIKDASSKAIYKEIPLVFKVKSGLSLRRAEQLITEMMDKHGIEQADRVEVKDYASTLENSTDAEDENEE